MNFPTSLDNGTSLPNPSGTDKQNSPDHAGLHTGENQAIIALEGKVGTGASTPVANTFLFGTGTGTSAWTVATSAQVAAAVSDETGTGSLVFATTPTLVTPKVDTINESTPANGVTIDGLNIKDNKLNTNDSVVTSNITAGAVTGAKLTLSYGFSAYSTTAQNTGNATFAQVNFQIEEFDIGSNFASSTFTAPVTGYYHFDAHVGVTGSPTTLIISLYKNGSEMKRGNDIRYAAQPGAVNANATVKLTATDTVDVRCYGSSAIAIDVSVANCYFMGYFIGN